MNAIAGGGTSGEFQTPSTVRTWPVIQVAAGSARCTIQTAASLGSASAAERDTGDLIVLDLLQGGGLTQALERRTRHRA